MIAHRDLRGLAVALTPRKIDPKNERDRNRNREGQNHGAAIAEEDLQVLANERDERTHQSRSLLPVSSRKSGLERCARAIFADSARRAQAAQRVIGEHLPLIHHDDAIGEALGFFHVMRRIEQCLAARLELFEVVEDGVAALADRRRPSVRRAAGWSGSCSRPAARLRRRFMPPPVRLHFVAHAIGRGRRVSAPRRWPSPAHVPPGHTAKPNNRGSRPLTTSS
jgi:hypothetical protein